MLFNFYNKVKKELWVVLFSVKVVIKSVYPSSAFKKFFIKNKKRSSFKEKPLFIDFFSRQCKPYLFTVLRSITNIYGLKMSYLVRFNLFQDVLLLSSYFYSFISKLVKYFFIFVDKVNKYKVSFHSILSGDDIFLNINNYSYSLLLKFYRVYITCYRYVWVLSFMFKNKKLLGITNNDLVMSKDLLYYNLYKYLDKPSSDVRFNSFLMLESRILYLRYWSAFIYNYMLYSYSMPKMFSDQNMFRQGNTVYNVLDIVVPKADIVMSTKDLSDCGSYHPVDLDQSLVDRDYSEGKYFGKLKKVDSSIFFNLNVWLGSEYKVNSRLYLYRIRLMEYYFSIYSSVYTVCKRVNFLRVFRKNTIYQVMLRWGRSKGKIIWFGLKMYLVYLFTLLLSLMFEIEWVL